MLIIKLGELAIILFEPRSVKWWSMKRLQRGTLECFHSQVDGYSFFSRKEFAVNYPTGLWSTWLNVVLTPRSDM